MRNKPWKNTQTAIELTSLLDVIFIVLMIVVCNQQISTKNQMSQAQEAMAQAEAMAADADSKDAAIAVRAENLAKMEAEAEAMLAEAEALKAQEEDVLAERDFYKEQLDTYENMSDQILGITVYVDYDPADIKNREIRYLYGNQEAKIPVDPQNMNEAYTELERQLGKVIFDNKDIPVIITVSRGQILYRDEKAVSEVLTKLSETHTNLFRK